MQAAAIIVAAGHGLRFGSELPKQFLLLRDRPVLAHTLQRFEQAALIAEVIIVASPVWQTYIERDILTRFQFKKCRKIVAGGEHRQDSVWAGMQALENAGANIIVVHDAVRPLFSSALLEKVIAACEKYDGCIPALALKDTVKQVAGTAITGTIARETLRLAQTPQAFRAKVLQQAFAEAHAGKFQATDEAALLEKIGRRLGWVEGEESNLKITTPRDLQIAEIFAQEIY